VDVERAASLSGLVPPWLGGKQDRVPGDPSAPACAGDVPLF
jgi:hypothetical protein